MICLRRGFHLCQGYDVTGRRDRGGGFVRRYGREGRGAMPRAFSIASGS
jgi:hypothetical protein